MARNAINPSYIMRAAITAIVMGRLRASATIHIVVLLRCDSRQFETNGSCWLRSSQDRCRCRVGQAAADCAASLFADLAAVPIQRAAEMP
jgi:hypothetical protein